MSLSVRMVVVLTAVGLISGGLLSVVNLLTAERIELNRQKEIEEAITRVVPGTQTSAKLYEEDKFTVYAGRGEGTSESADRYNTCREISFRSHECEAPEEPVPGK